MMDAAIVPDTPTPTKTPLPTPTKTAKELLYPYTIDGLREHKYQSGAITVRETLLVTDIFTRYLIEYPSDGLIITGIMQIPVNGKAPFPVIVMNHGFFSRSIYNSGDGTDRAAEFLNRHGYLTLSSDYRSWGGSDVGMSLFYSGLAIDVINLMNAIPSIAQADSNRVGMWGHSMGGGVTMKVLTIDDRPKAAVLYSTVSADFAALIERWGPGCYGDIAAGELQYGCNSSDVIPESLSPELAAAYFNSTTEPETLALVSPLQHLDLITVPVQLHYGANDGEDYAGTPPEWSKTIYDEMIKAGRNAQIFSYDGGKHSLLSDQWFAFMERSAQFFDKYVK